MILKQDEINRSIPYEKYFSIMKISEKQKRDRIAFAEKMEDELLLIMTLFATFRDYSVTNDNLIVRQLKDAYMDTVALFWDISGDDNKPAETVKNSKESSQSVKNSKPTAESKKFIFSDDYIADMALIFAADFVRATREHSSDPWYTSNDRVMFNAENEANNVLNYLDYKRAVGKGKTKKRWITMEDERVRETHREVDGKIVDIGSYFVVGECLMRFPGDKEFGLPQEIVGCRCSIQYS